MPSVQAQVLDPDDVSFPRGARERHIVRGQMDERIGLLVIGYGNSLRGDDRVGQHVALAVEARGWPGVRCIACTQLTPELAAELAAADEVVFVDACEATDSAHIQMREICAAGADSADIEPLSHQASPSSLLWMSQLLFGRTPSARLLTLPAFHMDLGESLSPETAHAAEIAMQMIWIRAAQPQPKEMNDA